MVTTVRFDTTPTISVDGTGITYGTFDAAIYSLTIKGKGKTGPKAKASVRTVQKQLFKVMDMLKSEGITIVPGKTRSTLSVDKDYERRSGLASLFSGYAATFTLTFRSRDLDRMPAIHDALTSIEGAEVASPSFLLDPESKENLRREAFKKAVAQAKQRFAEQCAIFDINPDNYEVTSWSSISGRDQTRNFKAISNFSPMNSSDDFFIPERANVEPGESRVEVTLVVNFNKVEQS